MFSAASSALLIGTDNSVRKQLADQLEHPRLQLEEWISSRTAELAEPRVAAESASHAKQIFLASTGHYLLTPMNGIMGITPTPLPKRSAYGMPLGAGWWFAVHAR